MKQENNVSELMKLKFGSAKLIPEDLLKKAGISSNRFWKIRTNKTQMYGWEAIVLAIWLGCEPSELYKNFMKKLYKK